MKVLSKLQVKYIGKCPWMEDVETVATYGHINGRALIIVRASPGIIWKYWYLEEFFKEWNVALDNFFLKGE